MDNEIKQTVEKTIREMVREFNNNPDVFLTEEDVRCHLVAKLLKNKFLSTLADTSDGSKSIPIHTEVRWYGASGKLRYRSDVVLLKTHSLKTKKSFHLPTKGYSFDEFYSIIEVKLRRIRPRSDAKYLTLIKEDFERLQSLIQDVPNTRADFYLICFDKKSDLSPNLDRYYQDPRINFQYVFKDCH